MSNNNQKNKALVVGTLTYAIGNFGTKILSFLIVPLYTFYILPEDLGDYDLLMTTVSLLSPLLTMKISDAAYRWIISDKEHTDITIATTYQLLFQNCAFASVLLLLINHFIPIWNCGYFIGILIADRMLECIQKLLRGLRNQKLFAVSGVFYTAVLVSLNFIKICIFHQGVDALLNSVLFSQLITISLIFVFEKRLRVFALPKDFRKRQFEMLKYSVPLVPSTLSWWVMSASDRYVIRWMIGKAANGIFAVAHKFPTILQTIFLMFNNAWTDMALAELKQGKEGREYASKIFAYLYKFSFGMALVLIPLTKLVTRLVLSPKYQEASIYIGFIYLGTVFQGFSSFCSIGYLQGKKTAGAAGTSIIGAGVNLVIDIITMRYIGLFAAAISTFAGFFAMWISRMHDIKKVFPIDIDKKLFLFNLILCIAMASLSIITDFFADIILSLLAATYFIIMNRDVLKKIVNKSMNKLFNRHR